MMALMMALMIGIDGIDGLLQQPVPGHDLVWLLVDPVFGGCLEHADVALPGAR